MKGKLILGDLTMVLCYLLNLHYLLPRLLMCFMCGDSFDLELPLAPLLNHQCCHVNHIQDRFPTVTLETYLDDSKRRVEVTVAAYHDTSLLRDELFHGYVLVYSALRAASLANLK